MWWWWDMEWWWCWFSVLSFRLINLGFVDLFVLFDFCRFGLWFMFWVLISLCSLGWFMMGLGFDFFVLWVDSSWVWVSFGFSILWLISHRFGLVLIFVFFGWFLMGLGFYFFVLWSGFWISVLAVLQTQITQQFRPDQPTTRPTGSNLKFGRSRVPFLFTWSNRVKYRLTQNLIRSDPWITWLASKHSHCSCSEALLVFFFFFWIKVNNLHPFINNAKFFRIKRRTRREKKS